MEKAFAADLEPAAFAGGSGFSLLTRALLDFYWAVQLYLPPILGANLAPTFYTASHTFLSVEIGAHHNPNSRFGDNGNRYLLVPGQAKMMSPRNRF